MDRIWLKQYPPGVPADIDPAQYSSLVALLEESFARFASRKAFICMDKAITYREIDEASTRARLPGCRARGLAKRRARRADDAERAAIPGRNHGGAARRLHRGQRQPALHAARATSTSSRTPAPKPSSCWRISQPRCSRCCAHTNVKHVDRRQHGGHARLQGRDRQFRGAAGEEDGAGLFDYRAHVAFNDAVACRAQLTHEEAHMIGPDDVAFLQYTGGTTGVSKGATLLHRNIVANVLQNDAWLQPALTKAPCGRSSF